MKKQFLLLACCTALFAACSSRNDQSQVKAMIDSTVNATVAKHDAENARKNDSIINAEAKIKAEAMTAAKGENKTNDTAKTSAAPKQDHKQSGGVINK